MPRASISKRLPITGYLDKISGRPTESLAVKISAEEGGEYQADVVRIVSADPNPDGPGLIYIKQDFGLAKSYTASRQEIDLGSYGVIASNPCFNGKVMLFGVLVQPMLLRNTTSVVASVFDSDGFGWELGVCKSKITFDYLGHDRVEHCIEQPFQFEISSWYHIWAGYDTVSGRLLIGGLSVATGEIQSKELNLNLEPILGSSDFVFAARKKNELSSNHFNGRLEDPALYSFLTEPGFAPPLPAVASAGQISAWWDFSIGIDTQAIVDRGPRGLGGKLVNIPYRGMRGKNWDGSVMNWCDAPREYAAIHFHEDDLYDCGWNTDFNLVIPPETPSGVYGLRLRRGDARDIIPFYVLPPKDNKKNKVCFLASTFTHQAYANHSRGNCDDVMRERMKDWGATPYNPDDYAVYGGSTYNFHPDGTGVSISSRLRPSLTIRPAFLTFTDAAGSGLRHFSADTHLLAWLEKRGIGFDVITDEDLDNEGLSLISEYNTLLTGSHPEYHTSYMLDSLQSYRDNGGKLVYLGGNGFYWKITRLPTLPGVIEVRRAEGGIRAWATAPGESYHQLDGEYGGLWRRNGRAPQRLVGVGFSSQGLFESSYYRRLPSSYDPSVSWIFDGVNEENLGDYGLSGGGAAGFELDRADFVLGTPSGTKILARSENHSDSFVPVPEELLSHINTVTGEKPADLVRAEIVYCEFPNGGAIFSVGSICFCGSLNHNMGENGVSKMLENVIRRFSERSK